MQSPLKTNEIQPDISDHYYLLKHEFSLINQENQAIEAGSSFFLRGLHAAIALQREHYPAG